MNVATRFSDVRVSAIRRIAALRRDTSIDLGLGEPDIEPPEWIREEAARVARESSWRYSPNAGDPHVRDVIARYVLASEGSSVCVTAGAEEALYAILQAWVGPGDQVLVPDPGFLAYPTLVRLAGGDAVSYQMEPATWQIDFDHFSAKIHERTKMVILNSPSNPTGAVLAAEDLDRLASVAEERSLLIVMDEVYDQIWYEGRPPGFPQSKNLIRVGGMSKSHAMTGLRLGWVTAPEELLAPIIVAHQYIATCASVFAQQLAAAVLARHDENQLWLGQVRQHFGVRRDAAMDAWEASIGTPVHPPAGAFYLFAPVPSCATEAFALQLAQEDEVLVVPGSAFGAGGEGWLRISYAADPSALREGIGRIGARLERQHR